MTRSGWPASWIRIPRGSDVTTSMALLALCVVVLAASGLQIRQPPVELPLAWGRLIRLLALLVVGTGGAVLLRQRRDARGAGELGADPTVVAFRTAGTIMVLLVVIAPAAPKVEGPSPAFQAGGLGMIGITPEIGGVRSRDLRPSEGEGSDPVVLGQRLSGISGGASIAGSEESPPRGLAGTAVNTMSWLVFGIVALLVLRFLTRRQRRRRGESAVMVPLSPLKAETAIEASLDEVLTFERDPGCHVTAAYVRLLDALADAGLPKWPEEAPHEHLFRALGPSGVPEAPLHELTGLYVQAQFSGRSLSRHDQALAAEALEASLAGVRTMTPNRSRTVAPGVGAGR